MTRCWHPSRSVASDAVGQSEEQPWSGLASNHFFNRVVCQTGGHLNRLSDSLTCLSLPLSLCLSLSYTLSFSFSLVLSLSLSLFLSFSFSLVLSSANTVDCGTPDPPWWWHGSRPGGRDSIRHSSGPDSRQLSLRLWCAALSGVNERKTRETGWPAGKGLDICMRSGSALFAVAWVRRFSAL